MEAWTAALAADTLLLLYIGILDFLRGEATVYHFAASYGAAVLAMLLLPVPAAVKAMLFATHLVLAGVFYLLYRYMNTGLLDLILAPHVPLLALAPPAGLAAGAAAALAVYLLHAARAARLGCGRPAVPGTRARVRAAAAWDKWYVLPAGYHPEWDWEKALEEKKKWRGRSGCVEASIGIPLVAVFAALYVVSIASLFAYL